MCRKDLPRVFDLIELVPDPSSPDVYFKDFPSRFLSEPLLRQAWLAREAEFQKLSSDAWCFLKKKARPYLTARDKNRGWEQLISVLNEARAYGYLQGSGYSRLRFIPESDRESPDIEGELNGTRLLCEVKTIQISNAEVQVRSGACVGAVRDKLTPGFFNKLAFDLNKAEGQMAAFGRGATAKHVVYVIINFDDRLAKYKAQYFKQIDDYICQNAVPPTEIVFHNQKTAFHKRVVMRCATVFNE